MIINDIEIYELCLVSTEKCNLNCVYCLVDKERGHVMSFETAKRAIDEMMQVPHQFSYYKITYMGGEPFMNFPLLKRIDKYISDVYPSKDVRYEIVTNGTLFNNEIKQWILSVCDHLQLVVSIDGRKKRMIVSVQAVMTE